MLGRILVTECHSLFQIRDLDDQALLDGLFGDSDSWQCLCLNINLFLDLGEEFSREIDGDEDDLGIGSVFGLGQEVGSNEYRVGSLVGNDLVVSLV